MHPSSPFLLFILVSLLHRGSDSNPYYPNCAPQLFECGNFQDNISYPFLVDGWPGDCGLPIYTLTCRNDSTEIQIGSKTYRVIGRIDYGNRLLTIVEKQFVEHKYCPIPSEDNSLPVSPPFRLACTVFKVTLCYNCSEAINPEPDLVEVPCLQKIQGHPAYYTKNARSGLPAAVRNHCQVRELPLLREAFQRLESDRTSLEEAVEEGFEVNWYADEPVNDQPQYPNCPRDVPVAGNSKRWKVAVGVGCGVGGFLLVFLLFYLVRRCLWQRRQAASKILLSQNVSPDPSSKHDLEKCSSTLYTHRFSYKELEEATNNFESSKKLGGGGYGTVYFGKLRDGRSVAVKRLYENNDKRVEQFMNEVMILSRLHHRNLVTLYGCTSCHSRELLLVYEFIPNGTVADHLHGDLAQKGALTWPIRMNIAIETAEALAYLHAIEPPIIHRDVKTNNILLDSNFLVKVADFGLSRLFPIDATHVSTTPRGTPGYMDPEYYKCYQLTDKSDVYSFGVVLMEIISSKPAVDIRRHRKEINLVTMAINKIQNGTLHELVDPDIGFNTDFRVRKMITLVAELGFRCLREEKDMRPCMDEVVKALKGIQREEDGMDNKTSESDTQIDDIALLKSVPPLSPDSVMDNWGGKSTTPTCCSSAANANLQ